MPDKLPPPGRQRRPAGRHGLPPLPRCLAILVVAASFSGCAALPSYRCPVYTLTIPSPFQHAVKITRFKKGAVYLDSPPYRLTTTAPMTEYYGSYGGFAPGHANSHYWVVHVYAATHPSVAEAIANAKVGDEAHLSEEDEFLDGASQPYLYARFERKHYPWGEAAAFFSQSSQDASLDAPNNLHLRYEVWGITRDGRQTVVAAFGTSHPGLPEWGPEVRSSRTVAEMKRTAEYRRVETCPPGQFTPSLVEVDQLLDSLRIAE